MSCASSNFVARHKMIRQLQVVNGRSSGSCAWTMGKRSSTDRGLI